MKYLIALILLATVAFTAMTLADDTLVRDGATCDIPKGFNAAPSGGTNLFGMSEFCEFPFLPILKEAKDRECETKTLPYPICQTGLVISPGTSLPCYKLITDAG